MEHVWVYIIGPLVGAVAAGFSVIIFYPQVRKSKVLENEAKQSDEWRNLYIEEKDRRDAERQQWESDRTQYEEKIDRLYKRVSEVRNEKAELVKENTHLEVENTKLKLLKCETPMCPNRKPPTGY